jgi:hypothetical protein
MHNALIFKEQAKFKEPELREKGLAQPHYSTIILKGMIFFSTKIKIADKISNLITHKIFSATKKDLHSSIIETKRTVLIP